MKDLSIVPATYNQFRGYLMFLMFKSTNYIIVLSWCLKKPQNSLHKTNNYGFGGNIFRNSERMRKEARGPQGELYRPLRISLLFSRV
jgi:hypothetical protein